MVLIKNATQQIVLLAKILIGFYIITDRYKVLDSQVNEI